MGSDESKRVVVRCPKCGQRLRLPAETVGTLDCPRCSQSIEVSTKARKLPALAAAGLVVVAWSAAVIPQRGMPHSAEVAMAASLGAYLGLHLLCKELGKRPVDLKMLEDTKLLFFVMFVSALPFGVALMLMSWFGSTLLAHVSVFTLLSLQKWLNSSGVDEWISTAASVGGVGLAILFLLFWLGGQDAWPARLLAARKKFKKTTKVLTVVVVSLASFSILAWTNEATLMEVGKTAAAEEYRRLLDSLDRLEASLRIVWGQRLAVAHIDHQLATPATTSAGPRAELPLAGQTGRVCERREVEDESCPAALLFKQALAAESGLAPKAARLRSLGGGWNGPPGGSLTEQIDSFEKAGAARMQRRSTSEADSRRSEARLRAIGDMEIGRVHMSAAKACNATACDKEPKGKRSLSDVTKLIAELMVDGIESAAPEIKLPEVLNGLGEFWQSLRKAMTKAPLKSALEDWVAKSLRRLVEKAGSVDSPSLPEAAVNEIKALSPRGAEVTASLQAHANSVREASDGMTKAIGDAESKVQEMEAKRLAEQKAASSKTREAPAQWNARDRAWQEALERILKGKPRPDWRDQTEDGIGSVCPAGQVHCRCTSGRDYGCMAREACRGPCE